MVVPQSLRWHGELAAAAGYAFLRTLSATLRMRWEDPEDHLSTIGQSPVIFALWHNRLILSLPSYRKYFLAAIHIVVWLLSSAPVKTEPCCRV